MDTETTCHCGCNYDGSDHCPYCGCEQYENTCKAEHPPVCGSPDADCQCRQHYYATA